MPSEYMSNNVVLELKFLMRLQSQDYITANQIQKELARMLPNDKTIKAFAEYLPDEAAYQEEVMAEEAAGDEEDEYYDEEEDPEAQNSSSSDNDTGANNENADATTMVETATEDGNANPSTSGAAAEEEKKDDDENEYDSDYDEEGNYIWGAEGEDWEFYYQEDKESYERGESTVSGVLNPDALP